MKPALGPRLAAHRPVQIFLNHPLVVNEHPVGNRVIVANNGIDQLVDELVGVKVELLDCPRNHFFQK